MQNKKIKNQGRSTQSRNILVVSDMHCGSQYAVCSEHPVINETAQTWKPLKHQQLMLKHWDFIADQVRKPFALVLNGEPINGSNLKTNGIDNWSSDINDQLEDARNLLERFNMTHFFVTRGSGYHVQFKNTNFEETLSKLIFSGKRSRPYSGFFLPPPSQKKGRPKTTREDFSNFDDDTKAGARGWRKTDYYLWMQINGKLLNFTHHIGFNRWFAYRTTALAREMAALVFDQGKYYPHNTHIDVIVRSHVHYYVEVRFSSSIGFTTPSWKLADPYMMRSGLGGSAPTIGAVEIVIEQNGKININPYIISKQDYPLPKILTLT